MGIIPGIGAGMLLGLAWRYRWMAGTEIHRQVGLWIVLDWHETGGGFVQPDR